MFTEVNNKFQKQYPGYKIVFLSQVGSILYGTNSESSDIDLKGIFVPTLEDVLLKKDPEHWTNNTNNTNTKNSADDVDCQLFSIYKFFDLLEKGETGAVDLLFAMFREDTTLCFDMEFKSWIWYNYSKLVPRKMQAFIGYSVGQSKRFGIKGKRYKELVDFTEYFAKAVYGEDCTISEVKDDLTKHITDNNYEYISIVTKSIVRDGSKVGDYLVVNYRSFLETNKFWYVLERLNEIKNTYGHRTEKASGGCDMKALSHSLRTLMQAEELLDTGFIKFPLAYAEEIKALKYSEMTDNSPEFERLLNRLTELIETIDEKIKTSMLPDSMDRKIVNKFLLESLKK